MSNSEEDKDKESSQLVEKMPEPVKSLISSFFAARQPVFPPFMEKINEEHISKVLDYSEKQDERDFNDSTSQRRYDFARFVLLLVVFIFLFVFLTVYLVDRDKELYKDILKVGLGALGGLAAGYGLGKMKGKNEEEGD
ncbi:MAG TPA: hypothetical protein VID27_09575 [Blastocatellia bacterium]|jgi:hypothetical protein